MAGVRNGDIVVRINGAPVWELAIGDVQSLLIGESQGEILRIEWVAAADSALAVRAVRRIRQQQPLQSSSSSSSFTSTSSPAPPQTRTAAMEQHRQRHLHAKMSPSQVEQH